ncbi:MAG: metal-dependent hydrolase [Candidatus Aenigmarchaeota archaeon]|nr:metal-dependent hydrolase [Candidatus Aenigmarchaeota archaeon]
MAVLLTAVLGFGIIEAGIAAIFSLLPDADLPYSYAGKVFPFSLAVNRKYGHRTVTHSLLSLGCVSAVAFFLYFLGIVGLNFAKAAILGYSSHLVLDLLNPTGIPLLWPKDLWFILLGGRIVVGELTEQAVFWILLVLSAGYFGIECFGFTNFGFGGGLIGFCR